ncbi:MAG: hypothetical protein QXI23_03980 [Candidatus Aenigmatarchaeota archaeon]
MKGIALEYVFAITVAIVVVCVSIAFITGLIKPELIPRPKVITDVRYACSQYNNSKISFENFKTVLYGFLTDQCNNFSSQLTQEITFEDITRTVKEIDEKINVVRLTECKFLETNTHSVFICCGNSFKTGENINITRKEIKNSDVLICGQ